MEVSGSPFTQTDSGSKNHTVAASYYSLFLLCSLVIWVGYLLLPKGLRKYLCRAYPRRYARTMPGKTSKFVDENRVDGQFSQYKTTLHNLMGSINDRNGPSPVKKLDSSPDAVGRDDRNVKDVRTIHKSDIDADDDNISIFERYSDVVDLDRPRDQVRQEAPPFQSYNSSKTPKTLRLTKNDNLEAIHDLHLQTSDEEEEINFDHSLNSLSLKKQTKSSPNHPDPRHSAPSITVITSCMSSLKQHPGIRLNAHGTKCEPRRVWIRLDSTRQALVWRTENSMSKSPSLAPSLGQAHFISLADLLYVDIGKTTASLKSIPEANIPEVLCFSILSKQGSLDLNAKTPLERDALVSCLCLILDDRCSRSGNESRTHWRALYKNVVTSVDKGTDFVSDGDE